MTRAPIPARWLAVLLAVAFFPAWAAAQDSAGEVLIELDSFGVGNVCRAGEYVGIRLTLTDGSDQARDVIVRVTMTDADGDHPVPQRVVTTNPGLQQPVWLYFRLPFRFQAGEVMTFSVHTALEAEVTGVPGLPTHIPGRLLGTARLQPQRVLSPRSGAYAVVARSFMGLREYGTAINGDDSQLVTGHEWTAIVPGIVPAAFPDRWLGLAQYDVIFWGEGVPSALSADQAQAIREWVRRGGHLVIIHPRVGQAWMDRASNPIFDLLPAVRPVRREQEDLSRYRPIITTQRLTPLPSRETVHVFEPLTTEAGGAGQAMRILSAPDGAALVVRRLEGGGAVTLVGLDATSRWFSDNGLPDPELFWHRILGRRGEMMTEAEYTSPERLARTGRLGGNIFGREGMTLDRDIPDQIAKTGRAAAGLLIGFVVFVAYWLCAGPVGYFVLKRRGLVRHAWVGFLAMAGLFTAIAWGGATAIRPHKVDASHLTILDHVYGQSYQRARSWASILVPSYGDASIIVGDPADADSSAARIERMHDAVTPWETPGGGEGAFPDSRAYTIDSRSPDAVRVPTRATVKQFQFDWAGGPAWKMPTPVAPAGSQEEATIRILPRRASSAAVAGSLVHHLPAGLTDVVVAVVLEQKDHTYSLAATSSGPLLARAIVARLPQPWMPGQPLDLSGALRYGESSGAEDMNTMRYLEGLLDSGGTRDVGDGLQASDPRTVPTRLTALSLFSQLAPPLLTSTNDETPVARRRAAHGYDLGRWFTQPCIIIIGLTPEDAPSPVPMYVQEGGEAREIPSRGRTLVRWVYPLPDDPPAYPGAEEIEPDPEQPPEEPGR